MSNELFINVEVILIACNVAVGFSLFASAAASRVGAPGSHPDESDGAVSVTMVP